MADEWQTARHSFLLSASKEPSSPDFCVREPQRLDSQLSCRSSCDNRRDRLVSTGADRRYVLSFIPHMAVFQTRGVRPAFSARRTHVSQPAGCPGAAPQDKTGSAEG